VQNSAVTGKTAFHQGLLSHDFTMALEYRIVSKYNTRVQCNATGHRTVNPLGAASQAGIGVRFRSQLRCAGKKKKEEIEGVCPLPREGVEKWNPKFGF